MPALVPPVDAPIVRPFDYRGSPFAAGLHRGVDFAAPAGTTVRAPCGGRVAYAGPSPGGGVVTLACTARRVTLLPVTRVAVQHGAVVAAGAVVARVARVGRHGGLHLGVRRAADRFGYVDPQRLLRDAPPLGPAPPPSRRVWPRGRPQPPLRQPARPAAPDPGRATAPWPAWLGTALVLAGATTGAARRRSSRLARPGHAAAAARGTAP